MTAHAVNADVNAGSNALHNVHNITLSTTTLESIIKSTRVLYDDGLISR
jgi:hypothetical protein